MTKLHQLTVSDAVWQRYGGNKMLMRDMLALNAPAADADNPGPEEPQLTIDNIPTEGTPDPSPEENNRGPRVGSDDWLLLKIVKGAPGGIRASALVNAFCAAKGWDEDDDALRRKALGKANGAAEKGHLRRSDTDQFYPTEAEDD